ncbi:MAG: glycosyltransferase [Mogibacterium sp.]|nr:glycosyltransferase [Mogibacterium sp.]
MRILSITAQKPHSTGSGTYMTELVKSFAKAGHSQAVVFGIYPDDTFSFPAGVLTYPVCFTDNTSRGNAPTSGKTSGSPDCPVLPFPITGMSDIMPYTSTRYRDLTPDMISVFEDAFISTISSAVDELDPDLIICHHLFLLTALVRKYFPGRRTVGISHGTDLRQMKNCENLRDIVRPYIAELDMAFALHSDQQRSIQDIFEMPADRTAVIGSGYNDAVFNAVGRKARSEGEPVRICYAGKVSRPKGVPEMLMALSILAKDPAVPDFHLTMAGGCQDQVLKEELYALPAYVDYLGQIPQSELAELLKSSDIFVLPSYFEGLPLVLIEAMASGAVPLSTDLPGVREWIDSNVTGQNVTYVPMPEMKSIDEPTDAGREAFVHDLTEAVRDLIIRISKGDNFRLPDTGSITWDSVAKRVILCGCK